MDVMRACSRFWVTILVAIVAGAAGAHVASAQPAPCTAGTDPETGDPWVVCAADANSATISHSNGQDGGHYHAAQICQQLGYAGLGQFGGNCGNVCGHCQGPTSCSNPGNEIFDGFGDCGTDNFGQVLCFTVNWQCVGQFTGATVRAPALSPAWLGVLVSLLAILGIRSQRRRRA